MRDPLPFSIFFIRAALAAVLAAIVSRVSLRHAMMTRVTESPIPRSAAKLAIWRVDNPDRFP